jgi:Ectodermal ciliogenesis protein
MLEDITRDGVQQVRPPYHLVFAIMNIILAGSGTILSSFFNVTTDTITNDEGQEITHRGSKFSKTTFFVGIFQLLLSWIIVGWVWSVYWGFLIFQKGKEL